MNKSIVLYTTGCPACQTLKLMLNKADIAYTENHSVEDMQALGFTAVPVLNVGGINMNFNEAKKWIRDNKGESE